MSKKNPDACSRGSLKTVVIAIHFCNKRDLIRKLAKVLRWAKNDSWLTVKPWWIPKMIWNEGGGGPCAPTFFDAGTVNYPPYAPNPMCCKKPK